jgi:hypothetical protein
MQKRDGSLWVRDGSGLRGVANVTAMVSGLVTNNHLLCLADSGTLGGDPASGIPKILKITYEIGGVTHVETFTENSAVKLGGAGPPLIIVSALYGDPKLVNDTAWLSSQPSINHPGQFRRIELPKGVVAFCGGRHQLGAALTADGEVWTWGETLGQQTFPIAPVRGLARLLNQAGIHVQWADPEPVVLKEPARLETQP